MGYLEVIIRIFLAIILGGFIGLERQVKQRPAGVKTHVLVCVGAATIMVLSEYMFRKYYVEFGMTSDPLRLGAQVVSGVGFLGAGTIIHHGQSVRGLTTAASLWVVAAIGLAAGAGFYFLAVAVAIGIYIILLIFNKLLRRFERASDVSRIEVELFNKPKVLGAINLLLANNNIKILDMEFINPDLDGDTLEGDYEVIYLNMVLKFNEEMSMYTLVEQIKDIDGVLKVNRS